MNLHTSDYIVTPAAPTGGYRMVCLECHTSDAGHIREWPPNLAQPFGFVCECGHLFHILGNTRANRRKSCHLTGEYKLTQHDDKLKGHVSSWTCLKQERKW